MLGYDDERVISAARSVLDRGGWCVFEVCVDVPSHRWEPHVVLFEREPRAIADAVAKEVGCEPGCDARLAGCNRRTLTPDPAMGAHLIYVAETVVSVRGQVRERRREPTRRQTLCARA